MPEEEASISEAHVDAFREKLEAWAETLGPEDQALAHRLVQQAAGHEVDEVSGFALQSGPMSIGVAAKLALHPAIGKGFGFSPGQGASEWGLHVRGPFSSSLPGNQVGQ